MAQVRYLNFLFIFCIIVSFLYCIVKGVFNGDFLGTSITMPNYLLVFNLVTAILPYLVLFQIYKRFRSKSTKAVKIPKTFFEVLLFLAILWNILVTVLYGVNVMGAPPYDAPSVVKPIIQLLNRINVMYGVFIYIFFVPKEDKKQFFFILLLLILAYFRHGLGVLLYIAMIMFIKYFDEFKVLVKRYFSILILIVFLFPIALNLLYNLRTQLRGGEQGELTDPLSGVLAGRMSSFSDSAFILQEAPTFFLMSQTLNPYYFQLQALGGVFSMDFMPEQRPEKMLFKFFYEESEDNVAYMAGTNGNLYISLMKSPSTFIINLTSILVFIWITFWIFSKIKFKHNIELAYVLLVYVVTSGVANEFSFLFFSALVYFIIFLTYQLFVPR